MQQPSHPVAAALRIARGAPNLAENFTGALRSPVAGRTDHLPISVPNGAYVIPADIVSALGQGNTESGVLVLNRMFPHSAQRGPTGGAQPTPIAAAGGEFVVSPQDVAARGGGDLRTGHAVLDKFVTQVRAENVKKLRGMPGPRR